MEQTKEKRMETNERTKPVLWVSRHPCTNAQISELADSLGYTVHIKQVSMTIRDAQQIMDLMRDMNAAEVVVNLPLHMVMELCHRGVEPIRSVVREKRHDHFERVTDVIVKSQPLSQEAGRA